MTTQQPNIFKVKGKIQNYAWGGFEYIPNLLDTENTLALPCAEYWLGTHPQAPMKAQDTPPNDSGVLNGEPLPYLFKILDVKQMLSIQVHPTQAQAQEGFERENNLGIALEAKNRNYKDNSDKPELMVALSPFWLLHGFAEEALITQRLQSQAFFLPLLRELKTQGLQAAFKLSLNHNNPAITEILSALKTHFQNTPTPQDKHSTDFWAYRWVNTHPDSLNGLLSVYFMNVIELKTGDGVYQPPGLLHAYLEGQNVEVMANSDNVLRAGLTPKHIDVDELLSVATIQPTSPTDYVLQQHLSGNGERTYHSPFSSFELSEFSGNTLLNWRTSAPELLFCINGVAQLNAGPLQLTLSQGEAAVIDAYTSVELNNSGRVFRTKAL